MKSFEEVMQLTSTISGNTALEDVEAQALYDCCAQVPLGGDAVEIGCQLGRSSSLIAQMAKEVGFHSIHIDPYIDNPEYLPQWVANMQKVGQPLAFYYMKSEQASHHIGEIDLLFVDGDHEYESVKRDLELFGENIKQGGFLTAHDYGNDGLPGVKKAIDEYIDHHWVSIGVYNHLAVWRRK